MFSWLTGKATLRTPQSPPINADDGKVASPSYHSMLQQEAEDELRKQKMEEEQEAPKKEFEISMCLVEKRTILTNGMRFQVGSRDIGTSLKFYNSTNTRGKALIIGNFTSDVVDKSCHMKNIACIQPILDTAGYETIVYNNLTSDKILEHLLHLSRQDHEKADSFVFYYCGKTNDQGLLTDAGEQKENVVKFDEIANCFSDANCKSLSGKPKIFLIDGPFSCGFPSLNKIDFLWSFGTGGLSEDKERELLENERHVGGLISGGESLWTRTFVATLSTHRDLPLSSVLQAVRSDLMKQFHENLEDGEFENVSFPLTIDCLRKAYSFGSKLRKQDGKKRSRRR